MRYLFGALIVLLGGCATTSTSPGRVVTPDTTLDHITWSEAEQAKPIAVRRLRATAETSCNLIRLAGAEKPHIHKDHDLVVVLLSGTARLHLGERIIDVRPGDVMEIPRGTVHWAENTGADASVVYALFSPPYDGKDNIPVPPPPVPIPQP